MADKQGKVKPVIRPRGVSSHVINHRIERAATVLPGEETLSALFGSIVAVLFFVLFF